MLLFSIMKKYCIIFVLIYLNVPGIQCLLPDNINEINHLDITSPYELLWTTTMAYSNVYHLTYKMLYGIGIPITNQFHPNEEIASILIPKNAANYEAAANDPPMQFLRFREASESIEGLAFESMSFQNRMNTDDKNTGLYLWSLIQESMVDFKDRINYLTNKLNSKQKPNTKQEMMGMYNDVFEQTVNTVLRSTKSYAETFNFLEKYNIKLNMNNKQTNDQNFNSHTFTQMKLTELYELYIKALTQFYNSKSIENNWYPSDFIKWYDLNSSKSIIDFMASKFRTHVITLTEYINEICKYDTSNLPALTSNVQEYASINLKNIIDIIKSPLKKTIIFKDEETNTFELFSSFTYDDSLSIDTLFDSKNKKLDYDRVQYILSNWNDINTKIVSNDILDKFKGSLIDTDITHHTKLMEWAELMTIDEKNGNVLESSVYAIIIIKNLENVISCMVTKNGLNSDTEDIIKVLLNDLDEKLNALYKYSLNPLTSKGKSIIPNIWNDIVNNKDNVFNVLDWLKRNDSNKNTPYWPNNEKNDEIYLKNVLQLASISSDMLFDVSLTSIYRAIKKDVIHSEKEKSKVLFILEDLEHSKHSYKEVTQLLKKYIINNLAYINLNLENDSDLKQMALQELSKLVKYKIFVNTEIIMPSYKKAEYYNLQKPNEEQIYLEHFKNMNDVFFQHFEEEPNKIKRKRANGLIRAYKIHISSIYKKIMRENNQRNKDEEYSKTLKQSVILVKKMFDIILNDLRKITKANDEANLDDNLEDTEKRLIMAVALITEDFIRYQEHLRRDDKQSSLFNNRYKYTTSAIDIAKTNNNLDYEAIKSLMNPENSQETETNDNTSETIVKVTQTTSSGTDTNQNESTQPNVEQIKGNIQTNSKENELTSESIGNNQDANTSIIEINTQTTGENPENDGEQSAKIIIQQKTISTKTNSMSNENESGEKNVVQNLNSENEASSTSDDENTNETKITITTVDNQVNKNETDDKVQTITVTTTQSEGGSNEQKSGEQNIVQVSIISTNETKKNSKSNEEENENDNNLPSNNSTEIPNVIVTLQEKNTNQKTKNQPNKLMSEENNDIGEFTTQSTITQKKPNPGDLTSPKAGSPENQIDRLPSDLTNINSPTEMKPTKDLPEDDLENIHARSVILKKNIGSGGSSEQNDFDIAPTNPSDQDKRTIMQPSIKDIHGNIYTGDQPGPSTSDEKTRIEGHAAKLSVTQEKHVPDDVTLLNAVTPENQMDRLSSDLPIRNSPTEMKPTKDLPEDDIENFHARSAVMEKNTGSGGSSEENDLDIAPPNPSDLDKRPITRPSIKDINENLYTGEQPGPLNSHEENRIEGEAAKLSVTQKKHVFDDLTTPDFIISDNQIDRLPSDLPIKNSLMEMKPTNDLPEDDLDNIHARRVVLKKNIDSGGSSEQNDFDITPPNPSDLDKRPIMQPSIKDIHGNINTGDQPGPSTSDEKTRIEGHAAKLRVTQKKHVPDDVTSLNAVSPENQIDRLPSDLTNINSPTEMKPTKDLPEDDLENIHARSVILKKNIGSGGSSEENDFDITPPNPSDLDKRTIMQPAIKDINGNIFTGDQSTPSTSDEKTRIEGHAAKLSVTQKKHVSDELTTPDSLISNNQIDRLPSDLPTKNSQMEMKPTKDLPEDDLENIHARSVVTKKNIGLGGSSEQNDFDIAPPNPSDLHKRTIKQPTVKDIHGNINTGDQPGPSTSDEKTRIEGHAAKLRVTQKKHVPDDVTSLNAVSPENQIDRLPSDLTNINSPTEMKPTKDLPEDDLENIHARSVILKKNIGSGGSSEENDFDITPPNPSDLDKRPIMKPSIKDIHGNIYTGDQPGPSTSDEKTRIEGHAAKLSVTQKKHVPDDVTLLNAVTPENQMDRLSSDLPIRNSPTEMKLTKDLPEDDIENFHARSAVMEKNTGSGGSSEENDLDIAPPNPSDLDKRPITRPSINDINENLYTGEQPGPLNSHEENRIEGEAAKLSVTQKKHVFDDLTTPDSIISDNQIDRLPSDLPIKNSPMEMKPTNDLPEDDLDNIHARRVVLKKNINSGGSSEQNDFDIAPPNPSDLDKRPIMQPSIKDIHGNINTGDQPGPSTSDEKTRIEGHAAKLRVTQKKHVPDDVTSLNAVSPENQMDRLPSDLTKINSQTEMKPTKDLPEDDLENIHARSVILNKNVGSGGSSEENDFDITPPNPSDLDKRTIMQPSIKDINGNIFTVDQPTPSTSDEKTRIEGHAAKLSVTQKNHVSDELTTPDSLISDNQIDRLPSDLPIKNSQMEMKPTNDFPEDDLENIHARSVVTKKNIGLGGSSEQNDFDIAPPNPSDLHKRTIKQPTVKDIHGNINTGDQPGPSTSDEKTRIEGHAAKLRVTQKKHVPDDVTSLNAVSPENQMDRLPSDLTKINSQTEMKPTKDLPEDDLENIHARSVILKKNIGSGGSSEENDFDITPPNPSDLDKRNIMQPAIKDINGNIFTGDQPTPSTSDEKTRIEGHAAKLSVTQKKHVSDELTTPDSLISDNQIDRLPSDLPTKNSQMEMKPTNDFPEDDLENIHARSVVTKKNIGLGGSSEQNEFDIAPPNPSDLDKRPIMQPSIKDIHGNINTGDQPGPSTSDEKTRIEGHAAKFSVTQKKHVPDDVTLLNAVTPENQMDRLSSDLPIRNSPTEMKPTKDLPEDDIENFHARSAVMEKNTGSGGSSEENDLDIAPPNPSDLDKRPITRPSINDINENLYTGEQPGPLNSHEENRIEGEAAKLSVTQKKHVFDDLTTPDSIISDNQIDRLPSDLPIKNSPMEMKPTNDLPEDDLDNIHARRVVLKKNINSGGSSEQNDFDIAPPNPSDLDKRPIMQPSIKDIHGNINTGDQPGPSTSDEKTRIEGHAAKLRVTQKKHVPDDVTSLNAVSPENQMDRLPSDLTKINSQTEMKPTKDLPEDDLENIHARSVILNKNVGSGGSSEENDFDITPPNQSDLDKRTIMQPSIKDINGNIFTVDQPTPSTSDEKTRIEGHAAKLSVTQKNHVSDELTTPDSLISDNQIDRLPSDLPIKNSQMEMKPTNDFPEDDLENIHARSVVTKKNIGLGGSSEQNDFDIAPPNPSDLHKRTIKQPTVKDIHGNINTGDQPGPSTSDEKTRIEGHAAKLRVTQKKHVPDDVTSLNAVSPENQMDRLPSDLTKINSPTEMKPTKDLPEDDLENIHASSVILKKNIGSGGSSEENDFDITPPNPSALDKKPIMQPSIKDINGNIYTGDQPGTSTSDEKTRIEGHAAKLSVTQKKHVPDDVTLLNAVTPENQMDRLSSDLPIRNSPTEMKLTKDLPEDDIENFHARSAVMEKNTGSGGSSEENDFDITPPNPSDLDKRTIMQPSIKDINGNIFTGDQPTPSTSDEKTRIEGHAAKLSVTQKKHVSDELTTPDSLISDNQIDRLPSDLPIKNSQMEMKPTNDFPEDDLENIHARSVVTKKNIGLGGSSEQNDFDIAPPNPSDLHKRTIKQPTVKDIHGNINTGDQPGPSTSDEKTRIEGHAAKLRVTQKKHVPDDVTSLNAVSPENQMDRLPSDLTKINSQTEMKPTNDFPEDDLENIHARSVVTKKNIGLGGSSEQNEFDIAPPNPSDLHKRTIKQPTVKDIHGNINTGDQPGPSTSDEKTRIEGHAAKLSVTQKKNVPDDATSLNAVTPENQMDRLSSDLPIRNSPTEMKPIKDLPEDVIENFHARSVVLKKNIGSGGSSEQNDFDIAPPNPSDLDKRTIMQPSIKDINGNIFTGDQPTPLTSDEKTRIEGHAAKLSVTQKKHVFDDLTTPDSLISDNQIDRLPSDLPIKNSQMGMKPTNDLPEDDLDNIHARHVVLKKNIGSGGSSEQNDFDIAPPNPSDLDKRPIMQPSIKDIHGNINTGDQPGPSTSDEKTRIEGHAAKLRVTQKKHVPDDVTSLNAVSPENQMDRLPSDLPIRNSPTEMKLTKDLPEDDIENFHARSAVMEKNTGSGGSSEENDFDITPPNPSDLDKKTIMQPSIKDINGNIFTVDQPTPSTSDEKTRIEGHAAKLSVTQKKHVFDDLTTPDSIISDNQIDRLPSDLPIKNSPMEMKPTNDLPEDDLDNIHARRVVLKKNINSGGSSEQNDFDIAPPNPSDLDKRPIMQPSIKDIHGNINTGDQPGPSTSDEKTRIEGHAAKLRVTQKKHVPDDVTSLNAVSPENQMDRLPSDLTKINSQTEMKPTKDLPEDDLENIHARSVILNKNVGSGGSSEENDFDITPPNPSDLDKRTIMQPAIKDINGNIFTGDQSTPSTSDEKTRIEGHAAKLSVTQKKHVSDELTTPDSLISNNQIDRLPSDLPTTNSQMEMKPTNDFPEDDLENIHARSVVTKKNIGLGGSSEQNDFDIAPPNPSDLHKRSIKQPTVKDIHGNIFTVDQPTPSTSDEKTRIEGHAAKLSVTQKKHVFDDLTTPDSLISDNQIDRLPSDLPIKNSQMEMKPTNDLPEDDLDNIHARRVVLKKNIGSGGSSEQNDFDIAPPNPSDLDKRPIMQPSIKDIHGNINTGDQPGPSTSDEKTRIEGHAAKLRVTQKKHVPDDVTSLNAVSPENQMDRLPSDLTKINSQMEMKPTKDLPEDDLENIHARSVILKKNIGSGGSSEENDFDITPPNPSDLDKRTIMQPSIKDINGNIFTGDQPTPSISDEKTRIEGHAAKLSVTQKKHVSDELTTPDSLISDNQIDRLPSDLPIKNSQMEMKPTNDFPEDDLENIHARSVVTKKNIGLGGSSEQNDFDIAPPNPSDLHKRTIKQPTVKDIHGNINTGDQPGPSTSDEKTRIEGHAAKLRVTQKKHVPDDVTSLNAVSPENQMDRLPSDLTKINSPTEMKPTKDLLEDDLENIHARSVILKKNIGSGGSSEENDFDITPPNPSALDKTPIMQPLIKDINGNIFTGDQPAPSTSDEKTRIEGHAAKLSVTQKKNVPGDATSLNAVTPENQMDRLSSDLPIRNSPTEMKPIKDVPEDDIENFHARSVVLKKNIGSGGSSEQNDFDIAPPNPSDLDKRTIMQPSIKDINGNIFTGDQPTPSTSDEKTRIEGHAAKLSGTQKKHVFDDLTTPDSLISDNQIDRLPSDLPIKNSQMEMKPTNDFPEDDLENIHARSVVTKKNIGLGGSSEQNDFDIAPPNPSDLHKRTIKQPTVKDIHGNINTGDQPGPSTSDEKTRIEGHAAKLRVTQKKHVPDDVTSLNAVSPENQIGRLPSDLTNINSPTEMKPTKDLPEDDLENIHARSVILKKNIGSGGSSEENDFDITPPNPSALDKKPIMQPSIKDINGNIFTGDQPAPSTSDEKTRIEGHAAKLSVTQKKHVFDDLTTPDSLISDNQIDRPTSDLPIKNSPMEMKPTNDLPEDDLDNIHARRVVMKKNIGSGGSSDQNDFDIAPSNPSVLDKRPIMQPSIKDINGNINTGDQPAPSTSDEKTRIEGHAAKLSVTQIKHVPDDVTSLNAVSAENQIDRLPSDLPIKNSPMEMKPTNDLPEDDLENVLAPSVVMKKNNGLGGSSEHNYYDNAQPIPSDLQVNSSMKAYNIQFTGSDELLRVKNGNEIKLSPQEDSSEIVIKSTTVTTTQSTSQVTQINSDESDIGFNSIAVQYNNNESPSATTSDDNISDNHVSEVVIKTTTVNTTQTTNIDVSDGSDELATSPISSDNDVDFLSLSHDTSEEDLNSEQNSDIIVTTTTITQTITKTNSSSSED